MKFKLGFDHVTPSEVPDDLAFLRTPAGRVLLGELDLTLLSPDADVPGVLEEFEQEIPEAKDRAANFRALTEVLGYVTFVVEAFEDNGKLYGYWHGPEGTPMKEAPIVGYDSEGTISLESGATLLDRLVCKASYEDEARFVALRSRLATEGVKLTAKGWDDWGGARPSRTNPETLHDELYKKYSA